MDKYEEMALKLIDYELKKFDHWKVETEQCLPLLMKRPLLALLTSEKTHLQVHLVCITQSLFKYLRMLHNINCNTSH